MTASLLLRGTVTLPQELLHCAVWGGEPVRCSSDGRQLEAWRRARGGGSWGRLHDSVVWPQACGAASTAQAGCVSRTPACIPAPSLLPTCVACGAPGCCCCRLLSCCRYEILQSTSSLMAQVRCGGTARCEARAQHMRAAVRVAAMGLSAPATVPAHLLCVRIGERPSAPSPFPLLALLAYSIMRVWRWVCMRAVLPHHSRASLWPFASLARRACSSRCCSTACEAQRAGSAQNGSGTCFGLVSSRLQHQQQARPVAPPCTTW